MSFQNGLLVHRILRELERFLPVLTRVVGELRRDLTSHDAIDVAVNN